MFKKISWIILLAGAGFLAWNFAYPAALKYFFRVTGTIGIRANLAPAMPGPNSMLFLVAQNEGGVPVAVKKVINPVFPLKFEMTPSNLIMPDLLTGRLYLQAQLNTHGQIGEFRRGDMKGERAGSVPVISKGVDIVLDTTGR